MKFKDYIQGNRYGRNANQLEREALNDPFLQDAMDGYDTVEGDFAKDLQELEKRIRRKANNEPEKTLNYKKFFGVAAIILVVVLGIGSLFYFIFVDKDDLSPLLADGKDSLAQHDDIATLGENNIADPVDITLEVEETMPTTMQAQEEASSLEFDDALTHTDVDKKLTKESVADEIAMWDAITIAEADYEEIDQEATEPSFYINKISGVVTDRDSNEPLVSVEITLLSNGRTIANAYTDFNGKYVIANIPSLSLEKIQISATGYDTKTVIASKENLNNLGGNAYQLDVVLKNQLSKGVVADATPSQQQASAHKEQVRAETKSQISSSASGKQEFLKYFEENRKQNICNGAKAEATVSFSINAQGKPERIFVKKSDCDELRQEVIRLLGKSPQWPLQKGTVELNIRVN